MRGLYNKSIPEGQSFKHDPQGYFASRGVDRKEKEFREQFYGYLERWGRE